MEYMEYMVNKHYFLYKIGNTTFTNTSMILDKGLWACTHKCDIICEIFEVYSCHISKAM